MENAYIWFHSHNMQLNIEMFLLNKANLQAINCNFLLFIHSALFITVKLRFYVVMY